MRYAIDQFHAFHSHVFCEGWFSGLANRNACVYVLLDGVRYPAEVELLPRDDLRTAFGPGAEKWGFVLSCKVRPSSPSWYGAVQLVLFDGERELMVEQPAIIPYDAERRGASNAELDFFRRMYEADAPNVLEIGSRKRSGNAKTDRVPGHASYVGFDIAAGPNVDVVGDAHFMSQTLPHNHFDFVFSISTFEHLLMPWKAAVELNTVMKNGGLAFIHSHQTWPVHDAPWDFYRFSKFGWHGIFNRYSGFEVIASEHAEPATIIPKMQMNNPSTFLELQTGYLMSVCLVKKIGPSILSWDADPATIMVTAYPG
ncbi:methyltransferase domain-containing protein [Paraburkholderia susongensis]|uniref:Methyltransferase domain-containing protein n=1 Tax=Paraburkholderia susongensis TaxID=1515439 RepID=A0A1X7M4U7_9BURK|nr:methyltransferase domain-containing protein [Paraburkholderia susongensis]SMG60502.1 Methyltransferase domain-containing protein [Paraburkholderia susongensis]